MERKNIYFVQTGCVFNNEHFLPYAVGVIAAYAFKDKRISSCYEISDIIYKCDDFEKTLHDISNPDVVAFSCYMWNYGFNLKLAKSIKELYPDCKIIFGGHQISDTKKCLEEYSFVDFAVFGEGEKTVADILLFLCGEKDISTVNNISYRNGQEIVTTLNKNFAIDVNEIPSPYLTGVFDKILKNNDDKFAAVIETSRGCPYHCTYCDWGIYEFPMRYFDVERVKNEIEYLGKNSVVFVVLADSNFGMRDEDEEIADKFIVTKNKYGAPKAVEIAFAKHSPERVFSINKKLYENDMSRGATLSMQSLDPVALKNIGRENITKEKFSKLLQIYAENHIPSYTELILGLPGETYESFCDGIEYLLDKGQHNSIHVFYCEILPNALMGTKEYMEKHKIQSLDRRFMLRNGIDSAGVDGKSRIVISTETMNAENYLKSVIYAFTVQVFHNFGLLRVVALYFHYEKNMSYKDFYTALIIWMKNHPETFAGKIFEKFCLKYEMSLKGKSFEIYENNIFGKTQFNLPDGAFLEIMCSYDKFYEDMFEFVSVISNNSQINKDMLDFQELIIRKPDNNFEQGLFSFDWFSFYNNLMQMKNTKLKKTPIKVCINKSDEYNDLVTYAEVIAIKGRRIGKSISLNDINSYVFEYTKEE